MCLQAAVQFGDTTVADRLGELACLVDAARAPAVARYVRALEVEDADELRALSTDFEAIGDTLGGS